MASQRVRREGGFGFYSPANTVAQVQDLRSPSLNASGFHGGALEPEFAVVYHF